MVRCILILLAWTMVLGCSDDNETEPNGSSPAVESLGQSVDVICPHV